MNDFKKPENYYEDFDPAKGDELILWRDGYPMQGRELNNLQQMILTARKNLGDALLKNGDIIDGAQITVDTSTGECRAEEGQVYLEGQVRPVAAAQFQVPLSGSVAVGIRLQGRMITEADDPSLKNPAIGSRAVAKPGAWRWRVQAVWAWEGDGGSGDFFPIHYLDDGVPRVQTQPPTLDSVSQAITKHDRESTGGGTYVVDGLEVAATEDSAAGVQMYTVSEGSAHVRGKSVTLTTSRRVPYDTAPELRALGPEVISATGEARQRVDVAHPPLYRVTSLRVTRQKTETVAHGAYAGVADPLKETSVVAIVSCRQGDTVYQEGVDYKKNGDMVDWSPAGSEPASGSSYEVVYQYLAAVDPEDQDFDGFSVSDAVAGSSILVSYEQALPRLDRLALTQDGQFAWLQGVAGERNWQEPRVPSTMLALATVFQAWRSLPERTVRNDRVCVVPFDRMQRMDERLDYALREVLRLGLESSTAAKEAGVTLGIVADPCIDDSMRDQGIPQTAAIVNGELTLSVPGNAYRLSKDVSKPTARPYTKEVVIEQLLRTGSMPVNPYMSFEPMPARVSLNPAVDMWMEVESNFTSPATQYLQTGHYVPGRSSLVSQSLQTSSQVVASVTKPLEFLRPIQVAYHVEGFGPGERLTKLVFDGIDITPDDPPTADGDGVLNGVFTIPEKIAAGSKRVECVGAAVNGSRGSAVFVGRGELTIQTVKETRTIVNYWTDPASQSFVFPEDAQLAALDLFFTAKGGPVRVQIRETDNGSPTGVILAEAVVPESAIVVSGNGPTHVAFENPAPLMGNVMYAWVVLCDDPVTALAVAEMGKFDALNQRWVTEQPYTVGTFQTSSNAASWTVHQTMDATFRAYKAVYSDTAEHQIDLGDAVIPDSTDLMLLALAETPTARTRMEYAIDLPDGQAMTVAEGQAIRLSAPVAGSVNVRARLAGDRNSSPLLWPGALLLAGKVSASDDYYSRSVTAAGATSGVLIYEANIPSGAAIRAQLQIDGGAWQDTPQGETTTMGDGWVQFRHVAPLDGAALLKAKFELSGSAKARPRVRNIRLAAIR